MALCFFLILAAVACSSAVLNWRSGVSWMILMAAVQDPWRKLIPAAPSSLLLGTIAVFLASVVGLVSGQRDWWRLLRSWFPAVASSLHWLILACLPAAFLSLTYGPASWIYTVYGALSYAYLPLAICVGFHLMRSERDVRLLLALYCLLSAPLLCSVFVEYAKLDLFGSLIGTKALGFEWIRYRPGYEIYMLSGFYRSPDVMGWHAACTVMLSMILTFAARGSPRWPWLGITALAIAALLVSGRRKMAFMIPVFVLVFVLILCRTRRRGASFQTVLILASSCLLTALVAGWMGLGSESEFVRYYTDNPADVGVQLQGHAWDSVLGTLQQDGFFGSGLGFASPGAQNLAIPRPRMWQESGPSRLMAEVGVPGLVATVLFLGSVMLAAWRSVLWLSERSSPYGLYAIGLLAFVMANVGSLTVSGQILADPFIACFIGISIGILLSLPRLHGRLALTAASLSATRQLTPRGG